MEVAFQALQDKFRVMEQLVATQRDQLLHLQRDRDSDPVPDRKNANSGKKKEKKSREQRIKKNAFKVYPGIHGKGGRAVSRAT